MLLFLFQPKSFRAAGELDIVFGPLPLANEMIIHSHIRIDNNGVSSSAYRYILALKGSQRVQLNIGQHNVWKEPYVL
jgi:hypothetical protein